LAFRESIDMEDAGVEDASYIEPENILLADDVRGLEGRCRGFRGRGSEERREKRGRGEEAEGREQEGEGDRGG
jgi:hypothetical protein